MFCIEISDEKSEKNRFFRFFRFTYYKETKPWEGVGSWVPTASCAYWGIKELIPLLKVGDKRGNVETIRGMSGQRQGSARSTKFTRQGEFLREMIDDIASYGKHEPKAHEERL
jgi:hypothetical protein